MPGDGPRQRGAIRVSIGAGPHGAQHIAGDVRCARAGARAVTHLAGREILWRLCVTRRSHEMGSASGRPP